MLLPGRKVLAERELPAALSFAAASDRQRHRETGQPIRAAFRRANLCSLLRGDHQSRRWRRSEDQPAWSRRLSRLRNLPLHLVEARQRPPSANRDKRFAWPAGMGYIPEITL